MPRVRAAFGLGLTAWSAAAALMGCNGAQRVAAVCDPQPREGQRMTIPEYICHAPDVLAIDVEPAAAGGKTLRAGDEVLLLIVSSDTRTAEDATVVADDGTLTLPPLDLLEGGGAPITFPPIKVEGLTTLGARGKIMATIKPKVNRPLKESFPDGW